MLIDLTIPRAEIIDGFVKLLIDTIRKIGGQCNP